ncbi:peptidase G2 [Staphylococcus equorum]|uniref:peptidase G2 autoproteolytic cleavage domain-containing protein n=1 Tax=Staphylococcus equorum TaxID=246432 RepID=UPI002040F8B1|nr:peptidase G2 autoproteolytic cleavage domain-containing protein [Staphylococcus equorum]MCM3071738.1 peptidase G2 [Staphylococcus equorum]
MSLNLIKKLHSVFGQKIVNQVESNFEDIESYTDRNESYKVSHKNTEKKAHNTTQIIHKMVDGLETLTSDELNYQRQQIVELVLGHNGNGIQELTASRTSMDAKRFPDLSNRLYHDFLKEKNDREKADAELKAMIQRNVNVDDYGGDPTGTKDSSEAFKKALGSGGVTVNLSAGTYLLDKSIKLPNYTRLVGQGQDISTIKLSTKAPRETIAITNLKMSGEARCISIENLAVNGDKMNRFPEGNGDYMGSNPSGGSLSSNIRFAGVTKGFVQNVKSYDPLLHCIDVTFASDDYFYKGDGVRVPEELESKYIWIENCEAYGFGDDGITTHHSRYLFISNCYSHSPKPNHGNANAFEIDDGSQFVIMTANTSYKSYGGIEIKAHATSSASHGIVVNGHISIKDCRSYNPRHIGHHHATTDVSKTAKSVVLNNCISLFPYKNEIYKNAQPRALVVSAYRNISINNFTAIGDDTFESGQPAIAVQFMSGNVVFNNVSVNGFRNASADIKVNGGANKGKNLIFSNVNIFQSSNKGGIVGGSKVQGMKIIGANLQGNGTGNGIESYNNLVEVIGCSATGYANNAFIANEKYSVVPTVVKGGFSGGSTGSAAVAPQSAIIASTGNSRAYDTRSYVLGSGDHSIARGSRSSVTNSLQSETSKGNHTQMVFNSNRVKAVKNYHVVAGYADKGGPSEKNIKYDLSTYTGTITLAGKLKQDNADIAELMESQSGQPIEMGMIVALDGSKVRKAQQGDYPIGIISGTASLVSNDKSFHHKDRYLKDEYGVVMTEHKEVTYTDDEGIEHSEWRDIPVDNPDYVEDLEYKSRSERPEWNTVGMLGQIYTNVEKDVRAGDFISGRAGIGFKDYENGRGLVMEITSEYTDERGCAIALVLWGVK